MKQLGWGITTWGWAKRGACALVCPVEVTSLIPSGKGQLRQTRLCRAPRPSSSPSRPAPGAPRFLNPTCPREQAQSAQRQHAPCSRFCLASLPPTCSSHPWFPAPPASPVSMWQHSLPVRPEPASPLTPPQTFDSADHTLLETPLSASMHPECLPTLCFMSQSVAGSSSFK